MTIYRAKLVKDEHVVYAVIEATDIIQMCERVKILWPHYEVLDVELKPERTASKILADISIQKSHISRLEMSRIEFSYIYDAARKAGCYEAMGTANEVLSDILYDLYEVQNQLKELEEELSTLTRDQE